MIKKNTNINTTYSQPSNLIPHFWNYKIVDKEGSPDLPCIMILSELFGWFRNLSSSKTYYSTGTALPELVDGQIAISYDFLADKLNFNKERIRRNLVKLETLGILTRDIRNITLENGSRINQLYLSINTEFFKSCFRDAELDIRVGNNDISHSDSSEFLRSPLRGGDHISKKNNNRSIESSFFNNGFEAKEDSIVAKPPLPQQKESKTLNDYYPLSKEDCHELQSISGREFCLTAMNEILKNMANRITTAKFWSKKGFIAYMSKAFRYEMRDAVKINNETFKIKANYSAAENNIHKQEKFLSEIESSLQINPEWYLKKKLASVLERSKAYNLLSNYKTIERVGDTFKFYLSNKVEIGEMDKQIILNQVRATHERVGGDGNIEYIDKVEFIEVAKKSFVAKSNSKQTKSELPKTIWGEIRSGLISTYGTDVDRAWFKDIESTENQETKTIKLKAESSFKQSWIKENYLIVIEQIAKSKDYAIETIEC